MATASIKDGIYKLNIKELHYTLKSQVKTRTSGIEDYLNRRSMIELKTKHATGLEKLSVNNDPCQTCIEGKHSKIHNIGIRFHIYYLRMI